MYVDLVLKGKDLAHYMYSRILEYFCPLNAVSLQTGRKEHHIHVGDAVDEVDGPAFDEVPSFPVQPWIVNNDLVSEIVGVA